MGLRGEHPWREVLPYAVAQIVGGCLGTLVAHDMFELPLLELAVKARTGSAQWFAEFVATFGLIVTILAVGTIQKRGDSSCGRPIYYSRLLVSGGHYRPRSYRKLFQALRRSTCRCSSSRS
jgi:glycerol uptake facilitator-like aquaporin